MTAEIDQEALCALYSLGRAVWPEIDLDIATFSTLAGPRMSTVRLDTLRAGDLYLAAACAAGVERAIAALEQHYLSGIASALVRRGYDAAAVADAVQAVRVRFLVGDAGRAPRISEYDGRGSLATWIQVAAHRIAISAHRRHHRETADEADVVAAERSPELALLGQRFGAEFEIAFRSAFEALTARERTLLRYQVIDRIGIDQIAAIHGIHRATAARWIAHAREALVEGVRRALQDRLGVDHEELVSLLRVVHSQLELSLRLLWTPSPDHPERNAG
ncbi:MAG TPA: sigma-70 family RNA polymerase sigma factor [Kofleriaceae bacterium]